VSIARVVSITPFNYLGALRSFGTTTVPAFPFVFSSTISLHQLYLPSTSAPNEREKLNIIRNKEMECLPGVHPISSVISGSFEREVLAHAQWAWRRTYSSPLPLTPRSLLDVLSQLVAGRALGPTMHLLQRNIWMSMMT
jgi:hypothetical protein